MNEDEALILGRKIRDYLVNGCELISSRELNSVEDYEALDDELNAHGYIVPGLGDAGDLAYGDKV